MSTRYRHESRSSSGEKSKHKLVATYCRGCYRTCALMMGVSKSTEIECCHEFVHGLNSLQKFPITRQGAMKKIEGFS